MDTLLRLSGSRPLTWTVLEKDGNRVGEIRQDGNIFMVLADAHSLLFGVGQGPYHSLRAAMDAIALHSGGVCEQPKRR